MLTGELWEPDGTRRPVQLFFAMRVPIQRHTKIQGPANPYDPAWEPYFERRLDLEMAGTLQGRRKLLYLWKQQLKCAPDLGHS